MWYVNQVPSLCDFNRCVLRWVGCLKHSEQCLQVRLRTFKSLIHGPFLYKNKKKLPAYRKVPDPQVRSWFLLPLCPQALVIRSCSPWFSLNNPGSTQVHNWHMPKRPKRHRRTRNCFVWVIYWVLHCSNNVRQHRAVNRTSAWLAIDCTQFEFFGL